MAKPFNRARTLCRPGFTLIEALVSLIIFGILTLAMSLAFSTALKTQRAANRHEQDNGTIRTAVDALSADLQSAFASNNNPASVFIYGASSSPSVSSGLLTLMTRTQRIQNDDQLSQQNASAPTVGGQSQNGGSNPQSELALIRYDYDPQAGTLSRTVARVPSLQVLSQATAGPENIVARNITDLHLRFWDTSQQTWRTDWDYEQTNQQTASASTAAGGTTAGASTGAAAGAATGAAANPATTAQNSTSTGDTMLPGLVELTMTVRRADGSAASYTTTVPIVANQPLSPADPPTNTASTSGSTNTTGTTKH